MGDYRPAGQDYIQAAVMPSLLIWKLISGGVLLLALTGAYFGWQHHERMLGAAAIEAADAKALAQQKTKDAELSAALVTDLQNKLTNREATAQPVREVIRNVTTPCGSASGPDVDAAAEFVRHALAPKAGGPATRR